MDKNNYFKLDGVQNGFAIYLHQEERFVLDKKTGKPKLFKNLGLAKSWLYNYEKKTNPYDYKVWIFLEDGLEIDFDDVEKISNYYEYYDLERGLIFIDEENLEKIIYIGYFVFEDGDTVKCSDKKYGVKRSKELMKYCKEALELILRFPELQVSIDSLRYDNNSHYTSNIKGCTGKIHICYNSQLMDLNMKRKEYETRCLPYDNKMDKYTTIYMYGTKDISDPNIFEIEKKMDYIKDLILSYLKDTYPESSPKFSPVEFKGTIKMEGLFNE